MYPEKVRVRLIPRDALHLPQGARRRCSIEYDHKVPVPRELNIPIDGIEVWFKRLFILINGGEELQVLKVIYVEK